MSLTWDTVNLSYNTIVLHTRGNPPCDIIPCGSPDGKTGLARRGKHLKGVHTLLVKKIISAKEAAKLNLKNNFCQGSSKIK